MGPAHDHVHTSRASVFTPFNLKRNMHLLSFRGGAFPDFYASVSSKQAPNKGEKLFILRRPGSAHTHIIFAYLQSTYISLSFEI